MPWLFKAVFMHFNFTPNIGLRSLYPLRQWFSKFGGLGTSSISILWNLPERKKRGQSSTCHLKAGLAFTLAYVIPLLSRNNLAEHQPQARLLWDYDKMRQTRPLHNFIWTQTKTRSSCSPQIIKHSLSWPKSVAAYFSTNYSLSSCEFPLPKDKTYWDTHSENLPHFLPASNLEQISTCLNPPSNHSTRAQIL